MYQSFTGQSRRPRQVNLSGRPTNPFAKANGTASGAQQAVASAQQDRVNRQIQRERIQASSRIQKVWRGHHARRRAFKVWREVWDAQEKTANGPYISADESLRQLRRLMLFFSPRNEPTDTERLAWYGTRQITTTETVSCAGGAWPVAYEKLQRAAIAALRASRRRDGSLDPSKRRESSADRTLLGILAFSARQSKFSSQGATEYYEVLTSLRSLPSEPLQAALLAPLGQSKEAYGGLVVLLEHPQTPEMLGLLMAAIDPESLAEAALQASEQSNLDTRSRLWLLGNLVCLAKQAHSMTFTAATARLLGSLADDVDFESRPVDVDNATFDKDALKELRPGIPLNTFLHQQVTALLDQQAIRNLLVGKQSLGASKDAQILAGYALTLLRCFPRRSDDIRMWLHLGPTTIDTLSPTRYLWDASAQTQVFGSIESTSRGVVRLLKNRSPSRHEKDDWTIILVFLEMFGFDLKIMDDEEFMGNSSVKKRNSAVSIPDVARLVTFLKHLGFTLYHDATDLNELEAAAALSSHSNSHSRFRPPSDEATSTESRLLTIAGLPGLTIDYLKGLVTGLLRSIYERDSRRNFLPKNHWLMTDRFDMSNFIEDVVKEEEKRLWVQEQDAEDGDDEDDDEDDDDGESAFGTPRQTGSSHARLLRAQEARARAQRKASRKRYLQSVAPKQEILRNMPFIIPFHTRVEAFRKFVFLDQYKRRNGTVDPDLWRHNMMFQPNSDMSRNLLARHHAKIKRSQEFLDAYEQFYELGADLKEPIQITFVDQWDMPEAGIDGGGVTKEFLTSVINQAFDQSADHIAKFFIENDQNLLFPNPTAFEDLKVKYQEMGYNEKTPETREALSELAKQYEFLGRIIGKCLYEGILIDVSFAGFFLKKWALTGGAGSAPSESHYRPSINDLRELDESLYRGLLQLKNAEDAEELGMTFSVNDAIGPDERKRIVEIPLAPNGANIAVTNENRLSYINRIASYRLQGQAHRQSRSFLKGLGEMIQPSWLAMFNQAELQTLIGGSGAGIDIQDLRRNTLYGGTYVIGNDGLEHPSIQLFWHVMQTMKEEDRRKVLKFVTSTPRGPLLGFSYLTPKFSIRDSGSDENRYPTTSTCVNLLKLPMYKSEKVLREKLLAAVSSGAGFDLS